MKTKIICILDRSGSMSSIINDAIGGFNSFLKEQQEIVDTTIMDILLFDSAFDKIVSNVDIHNVQPLNNKTYVPRGSTALLDAIGITIDSELDYLATDPNNKSDKTLCVILTDGEENSSTKYQLEEIKTKMKEMEKEFNWNFIYLAANQDAITVANSMGISRGNTMNFSADSEGVTKAYQSMSKATAYYRTASAVDYDNIFNNDNENEKL